jgi:hypothetical protein
LSTDQPVILQAIDNLPAGQLEDGTALGQIYSYINQLERAPLESKSQISYTELYRWFLGLALGALLLELGLTAWRAPLP